MWEATPDGTKRPGMPTCKRIKQQTLSGKHNEKKSPEMESNYRENRRRTPGGIRTFFARKVLKEEKHPPIKTGTTGLHRKIPTTKNSIPPAIGGVSRVGKSLADPSSTSSSRGQEERDRRMTEARLPGVRENLLLYYWWSNSPTTIGPGLK